MVSTPSKIRVGRLQRWTLALLFTSQSFIGAASLAQPQTSACPSEILNAPIYWDMAQLRAVKSQIGISNPSHRDAYAALVLDADAALSRDIYSVTDKLKAGPSGDLRDYVSLARYYWPDPTAKDGRPYVRKDGQTNPEINGQNVDRRRSQHMTDDVMTLSLAAYFTGNAAYSDKATQIVKTWFLDDVTGMNPHLKYAQNIPGVNDGREFGILDGRIYWNVMDSMLLLQSADLADTQLVDELRDWFAEYAHWLLTSDFGKKAKARKNNHGVFYDAQLAHVLLFTGQCDLAAKVVKRGHGRTKTQIDKSGLMPEEKERTKSLFYHAFNLQAFLRLSHYGQKLDLDIYDEAIGGSGSIKDSVEFVASYAGRTETWPYEEITQKVETAIWEMLRHAQQLDDDPSLQAALTVLEYNDPKNRLNLISRPKG